MAEANSLAAFRRELAQNILNRPGLSDVLKSALVWACQTEHPPHTRKVLAHKTGVSTVTLWRHARAAFPNGPSLPELEHFLALLAELQLHFANPTRDAKRSRARAVETFGVFPIDEAEAVTLARAWLSRFGM